MSESARGSQSKTFAQVAQEIADEMAKLCDIRTVNRGRKPIVMLTIPGRVISLKNSKRIVCRGRFPKVLPSERYVEWEANAMAVLKRSFKGQLVDYPCELHARFYFANHSAESDLSNCIQGPEDVLQTLGLLKDDKLIQRMRLEKFFGHEPRVEIEIYKYEQGDGEK